MVPMERLLEAWRADPREEPTVELCAMLIRAVLKATGQKILPDKFVIDFVAEATEAHRESVEVAIACGDLFLATGLVSNARSLLERTAEIAPRDLRVKERVLKLGKLRRTQELASRSPDPETLDAPTTPLDPETEPVKDKAPPAPILLPRNPRRQATVHGIPPAGGRKPTVKGVASPLAEPSTESDNKSFAEPKTETDTSTSPPGADHPRRSRTLLAGFGAPPPAPAARPDRRSDPPTRTSVGSPPASDDGPPTRVDPDGPPTRAGAEAMRQALDDEGPATQAPTLVGPAGDDGPATAVGPDGPPTAVRQSSLPPPNVARAPVGSPAQPPPLAPEAPRPAARRAAIRKPPPPRAAAALPRPPPIMGPLEDSVSEHDGPTNVTALPPIGPQGLVLDPPKPAPPPPQSDEGEDDPPTRARELAPMAPRELPDAPTRTRGPAAPMPRPRAMPAAPPSDPDGDTATNVKDFGTSQEAPTLSGALTAPFTRPESVRPWPGSADGSFPQPGAQLSAQPVAGPVGPGGTLAMSVSTHDGDHDVGTLVLNAAEALAAARIDPRSPHARGEAEAMLSRGQMVAAQPSYESAGPPAPTFGPPPSAPPAYATPGQSFGPPPGPSFGPPASSFAPPAPSFGPPSAMDPSAGLAPGPSFGPPPDLAPATGLAPQEPPPMSYGPPQAAYSPQNQLPAFANDAGGPQGGGFSPSAFPDPFGAASLDPNTHAGASPSSHRSSRPFRLYVALGVAVVAVASLVGYATYLVLGDSGPSASVPVANRPIPEDLERALLSGSPPDLLKADSILRGLEGGRAPEILLARVRERALTALDVSGDPAGIEAAVNAATAAGVPAGDVAFASMTDAILRSQPDRVAELVKAHETERKRDPYFALMVAVSLERKGDPLAAEALRSALAVEPKLRPASVRLARWLVLNGDAAEAKTVIESLPEADPARKALEALAATKLWLAERKPGAKPPAEPPVITAEISKSLHPIFAAVKLVADAEDAAAKRAATGKSNPEAQAQLKRAIDEADGPAVALLFGDIALARGDESMAVAAASRALTLAPGSSAALTMLGRASVSLGKLDQLDAALAKLPPDATLALRAFSAYEQGKNDELTKIAQGLNDQIDPGAAVRTRLARVRGTAPIPADAIERLLKADPVGGDLCAVDAWLDAGELERARTIVDTWRDASTNPLRAARLGRLLRYEGKPRDAVSALGAALPGKAVLVERILLGAESSSDREQTLALIDERLGTDRAFWNAYVLAKIGQVDKAKAMLEAAAPPSFDTPLASRLAAVLAYAEVQDTVRGEPIARVLLESFPKNPDVKRAGKALGVEEKR